MKPHTPTPDRSTAHPGVPWRAVGLYVLLAFTGFWLAMLPLLISGYQRTSADNDMSVLIQTCIYAAMLTPALAALSVLRFRHRVRHPLRTVGLIPRQRPRTLVRPALVAIAVPFGLQLVALAIATVAGAYHPALTDFSGFRAQFA